MSEYELIFSNSPREAAVEFLESQGVQRIEEANTIVAGLLEREYFLPHTLLSRLASDQPLDILLELIGDNQHPMVREWD